MDIIMIKIILLNLISKIKYDKKFFKYSYLYIPVIIAIFFTFSDIISCDIEPEQYCFEAGYFFPLEVGNYWEYHDLSNSSKNKDSICFIKRVIGKKEKNGKLYYIFENFVHPWIKQDTTLVREERSVVYFYSESENREYKIFDFCIESNNIIPFKRSAEASMIDYMRRYELNEERAVFRLCLWGDYNYCTHHQYLEFQLGKGITKIISKTDVGSQQWCLVKSVIKN